MKGTLLKDFGGKDRYLRYNMEAWQALDEHGVKVRLGHVMEDMMELSIAQWYTVVWAGLLHAEPALELEDMAEWLSEDKLMEVARAFFERLGGTPTEEEGVPDETTPAAPTEQLAEEAMAV